MDIKTFQEASKRTFNTNLTYNEKLCNCVAGMFGEGGEVADIIKKHLFQGHSFDRNHIAEEIGDLMFYIVNLATVLNMDMEDILDSNVDKLKKRFPDGFSTRKSIEREDRYL